MWKTARLRMEKTSLKKQVAGNALKIYFVATVIKNCGNQLKGKTLIYKHTKLRRQKQNNAQWTQVNGKVAIEIRWGIWTIQKCAGTIGYPFAKNQN